ncbi:DNA breaking-rejoining enzyme [Roridomyces roridus]|uniref:DNA breaking-rejoining enzyme n=1 Tax=Roridomyces roridus TaxID=1738132 RepID=A0AAD7CKH6_9AGAR|nr:DNA breaking-rejoining enzyme [Roridomyces roridus]
MRAATTYGFGPLNGLGSVEWQKSEVTAKMRGNPSVSETVSSYMLSLRKKKVRTGEVPTSARAITPEILEELYHYNNQEHIKNIQPLGPRSRKSPANPDDWCGRRTRVMLYAVYIISFLCLLRFDEALKIQVHEVRLIGDSAVELTLPFRKTNQDGDIKPFVLHEWRHAPHLCPVRAIAEWIALYEPTNGYLFPPMNKRDQPGDGKKPMKTEKFLELFRHNLLDICLDPWPYGTHSFRRGGCQFFSTWQRWSLRRVCEWGGWSTEFSNLTIVKYLIGWNDDPTETRENFLNPTQKPTMRCATCGRNCACGF